MRQEQRRYQSAGFCILFFIAAQTFQELATRIWIPAAHGPEQELLTCLLPIDRDRALLILSSILLLVTLHHHSDALLASDSNCCRVGTHCGHLICWGLNSQFVASTSLSSGKAGQTRSTLAAPRWRRQ